MSDGPDRPSPADELRADVRARAENRPGVYRLVGPGGRVLYVGKSARVRTRLLSYFRSRRGDKAAEIVGHTHSIDWEYTPSEFASVLLEMRWIRKLRPPYNVEHKRERAFCFVKVTREEAPRMLPVHYAEDDGATYYGPFRGPRRVRALVREVVDLLQLRDCPPSVRLPFADQIELFRIEEAPRCVRGDLDRCLSPCARRCTRAEYAERVELARRFLDGDADAPIALLHERMRVAAERMHFEYARELRDRAAVLESAREELISLRRSIDALSFAYRVRGFDGEDRLYVIRRGSIRAEFPFPATPLAEGAVRRRVDAILGRPERGLGSIRPEQAAEALLVARWFRLRPEELENVVAFDRVEVRAGVHLLAAL